MMVLLRVFAGVCMMRVIIVMNAGRMYRNVWLSKLYSVKNYFRLGLEIFKCVRIFYQAVKTVSY